LKIEITLNWTETRKKCEYGVLLDEWEWTSYIWM